MGCNSLQIIKWFSKSSCRREWWASNHRLNSLPGAARNFPCLSARLQSRWLVTYSFKMRSATCTIILAKGCSLLFLLIPPGTAEVTTFCRLDMTNYILRKTNNEDNTVFATSTRNLNICNMWEIFCDGVRDVEDNDVHQVTSFQGLPPW